jgi:dephospho-CoA kinase
MLIIGLTGGIGSGKSTVAKWFQEQGVAVMDADKIVHNLLKTDELTISSLRQKFGPDIFNEDGQISRPKLGAVVFSQEKARKWLEEIIHPRVLEWMKEESEALRKTGAKICVWDVPLLFETGFEKSVDQVWVVWVPGDQQIKRVQERDNLNKSEVEARIAAQGSLEEKCKRADVVIDNSGTELETRRQLDDLWKKIQS